MKRSKHGKIMDAVNEMNFIKPFSPTTATEVMYQIMDEKLEKSRRRVSKAEAAYILVKVDGYTYREAAKILGLKSPNSVDYWIKKYANSTNL
jgi:DNA-directed RNA polymerase specialized sigma24 family protein